MTRCSNISKSNGSKLPYALFDNVIQLARAHTRLRALSAQVTPVTLRSARPVSHKRDSALCQLLRMPPTGLSLNAGKPAAQHAVECTCLISGAMQLVDGVRNVAMSFPFLSGLHK